MHDGKGREDRTTSGTHAAKHGGNRHIHPRVGLIARVERGETETHHSAGGDIQSRRKVFGQCSRASRKGETTRNNRDFLEGRRETIRLHPNYLGIDWTGSRTRFDLADTREACDGHTKDSRDSLDRLA